MNTLTYLSRQFDVLASPRAPPSTPSEERTSFLTDGGSRSLQLDGTSDASLKRVKTWSTKSFLLPPTQQPIGRSTPKRSFSSPADVVGMAALSPRPVKETLSEAPIRSKSAVESLIRRTFLVRVFFMMWGALRAAWASLIQRDISRAADMAAEEGIEKEVKKAESAQPDTQHVLLSSQTSPTHRQIIPAFPPPSSTFTLPITLSLRSRKDPSIHIYSEPRPESDPSLPTQLSLPASQSGSTSRASPPPTRKTPFHLQQKTLVLDLDETLIHSTSKPMFASGPGGSGLLALGGFGKRNKGAGHVVEVVLGGRITSYHVYKRPFVDYFLRKARVPFNYRSYLANGI